MVALPLIAEIEPAAVCAQADGAAPKAIRAKSRVMSTKKERETVFLFTTSPVSKLSQSMRGESIFFHQPCLYCAILDSPEQCHIALCDANIISAISSLRQ